MFIFSTHELSFLEFFVGPSLFWRHWLPQFWTLSFWFSHLHSCLLECGETKGHVWCYTCYVHQKVHLLDIPHASRGGQATVWYEPRQPTDTRTSSENSATEPHLLASSHMNFNDMYVTYLKNSILFPSSTIFQMLLNPPKSIEPLISTAIRPANIIHIWNTSVHNTAFMPPWKYAIC